MTRWTRITSPAVALALLIGAALFLTACDSNGPASSDDDNGDDNGEVSQTIQQVLGSTDAFSQAQAAFTQSGETSGFDDADAGPITVFVPSNAAFTAVNETALLASENASILRSVMGYHIVDQGLAPGEVSTQSVPTRAGSSLDIEPVDGTSISVNGSTATLVATVDNGLVYELDAVQLQTLTFLDRATVSAGLARFADALEQSGLASLLEQGDGFTVFAPADAGFAAYRAAGDIDPNVIMEWLSYHVVQGERTAASFTSDETLPTGEMDGGVVQIGTSDGVSVNGVPVQTADLRVRNGILHVIERPLTASLSLAEHASIRADLQTLSTAIGGPNASTVPVLDDESQSLTLFAPSETAFSDIDVDELVGDQSLLGELLSYHLLDNGAFSSVDLTVGPPSRTTSEGESVTVDATGPDLLINRATVTAPDQASANGVLHVLDGVLLETTRGAERIQLTSNYSLLQESLNRVGLTATLASGTYTIFPPTNAAFLAALDSDGSGAVENDEFPSDAALEDILLYHVIPGTVPSRNIDDGDTGTTLEGSSLTFDVAADGTITLNPSADAAVITRLDLDAENGILHEIDTVLIP